MAATKTRTQTKATLVSENKGNKFKDPMAPAWTENYSNSIEKYWSKLPASVGSVLVFFAVFIFGATVRGEWVHLLAHMFRAYRGEEGPSAPGRGSVNSTATGLEAYYLKDLPYFVIGASVVSYTFYLGIGGFLHWYYYVSRRHLAHDWKCQPDKWLSPALERHEILLGSFCLVIGSVISATIACYVFNGGPSRVYYDISDYGWAWYFLSWPVTFVYQDYLTYVHHRLYHTPTLYKLFHKLHHTYKQPTAFSVTAIHPVEFVMMQCLLISPMVLFPIHWSVLVTLLLYCYYHGIIDHSGINFKAYWWQPWQPDCIFHDNHHQYFHVNFGFNCALWDKLHGTYRQKDKIYREDIYFGKGKDISECNEDELRSDLLERQSENKLAYRGDVKQQQVEAIKKKIK